MFGNHIELDKDWKILSDGWYENGIHPRKDDDKYKNFEVKDVVLNK